MPVYAKTVCFVLLCLKARKFFFLLGFWILFRRLCKNFFDVLYIHSFGGEVDIRINHFVWKIRIKKRQQQQQSIDDEKKGNRIGRNKMILCHVVAILCSIIPKTTLPPSTLIFRFHTSCQRKMFQYRLIMNSDTFAAGLLENTFFLLLLLLLLLPIFSLFLIYLNSKHTQKKNIIHVTNIWWVWHLRISRIFLLSYRKLLDVMWNEIENCLF